MLQTQTPFHQIPLRGEVLTIDQAMKLAIGLAYMGAPYVSPNPLVGAVILNEKNEFLSAGYHKKCGEAHAEVEAFKNLLEEDQKQKLKVIITLEPCAHEGRTPSCAKMLITKNIFEVIYGLPDPNPLVAGQGAQIIQNSGFICREYQGLYKNDLEDLAENFLKNFREKKVFVAAKLAQSLDGQIALANGESQWITSDQSREFVHELRSRYDAIVAGVGTVLKDNPSLSIRHPHIKKVPYVIIVDPHLKIFNPEFCQQENLKLFKVHQKQKIIIACYEYSLLQLKKTHQLDEVQFVIFRDLTDLMSSLWNLQIRSVFIEGGPRLLNSFFKEKLIDRIYVFTAPVILGQGLSWAPSLNLSELSDKIVLRHLQIKNWDSDFFVSGRLYL